MLLSHQRGIVYSKDRKAASGSCKFPFRKREVRQSLIAVHCPVSASQDDCKHSIVPQDVHRRPKDKD